ncbi:MAG TPA: nitroreductase family protein [Bacillota bacterium]|nr:nitroreductase family protein [Bacillota bacterium]
MELPVEKWYRAISKRRSCRRYFPQYLPQELVYQLWHVITKLNETRRSARIELLTESPDPVLKGIIGPFGKIKGARAYAAFIGATGDEHVAEETGYLGECFILEATANQLATCWVGGTFKAGAVAGLLKTAPGEEVLAIATVGFPYLKHPSGGHNRKPLEKLCTGLPREQWPSWAEAALEAARLAPSACNRQPWRFTVAKNSITISLNKPPIGKLSPRLDCGIAMLHLELGALSRGVRGHWEYLASPEVARFTVTD